MTETAGESKASRRGQREALGGLLEQAGK